MTWMDFVAQQWLLFGILAVLVAAFLYFEQRKGGPKMSFHEATRALNSGQAIVLDVRDTAEFKKGHIVDAINIPHAKLAADIERLAAHKDKQIIVVDKMGQHAGAAGKVLLEKGYNAARLQGGIVEWSGQNLPLVKA